MTPLFTTGTYLTTTLVRDDSSTVRVHHNVATTSQELHKISSSSSSSSSKQKMTSKILRKPPVQIVHSMVLLIIGWTLFVGNIHQCQAELSGINNKSSTRRSHRRRLDPLKEASPESHRRVTKLLNQLSSTTRTDPHHQSSYARRDLKLVDHLNTNRFSKIPVDEPNNFPSRRTWTIQLKSPPIWICRNNNGPSNKNDNNKSDCGDAVKQEQDDLIFQLRTLFPSMTLVGQAQHILNTVFVELPFSAEIPSGLEGVQNVELEEVYGVAQVEESAVLETVGAKFANEYCLTGAGVKVGILDTGVDYTHEAFGGNGTSEAYLNVYGVDRNAAANKNRDGWFPTPTVVEGFDFLGEDDELYIEDDDPIDANGHGTAVASAVLSVAPDVQLVAVKACLTGPTATCPESAMVQAIEFMLDPFKTGTIDDKVDIINLSLTASFNKPYYDRVALALENAAQLGVLCVTAFGNFGNIPYISGAIGGTPNAISVGGTNRPSDPNSPLYMDSYSARGPGEANLLKPDLSAPGTLTLAMVGTGNGYAETAGTSFSAPLVAGAAALLRQHCPMCDPFAIKCLLMNTADRNILYGGDEGEERMAPVTRMGSGMLRVDKALNATLWAFSLEERQPSLSFGVVDASLDIIFTKSIRIHTIDSRARTIRFDYEFRDPTKGNVVNVTFFPEEMEVPADCSSPVDIQVQFYVIAQKAPPNTMTTAGFRAFDAEPLDRHEFDGHILISSEIDQEASLPFHLLVRQAAAPELAIGTALPFEWGPIDQNFTIINQGLGTAQIDAFELVYSDKDDEEAINSVLLEVDSDIRSIGYRTIPVGEPGCNYTVEFSFQTWERSTHVGHHMYMAEIYPNGTDADFLTLVMLTYPFVAQTYVVDATNTSECTGFTTDHASNTVNTILRACSDDLLLEDQTEFTVQFRAFGYPRSLSASFLSSPVELTFPEPRLFAPSYDIGSQETLRVFNVKGEISPESYGLQLVTNSFRDWNRTGAASSSTETLLLVKQGVVLESEVTPDVRIWPGLFNQSGPTCDLALPIEPACQASGSAGNSGEGETAQILEFPDLRQTPAPACPPVEVPRLVVPTPSPTESPSDFPTAAPVPPTPMPTPAPTLPQTSAPTFRTPPPVSSSASCTRAGLLFVWATVIASILLPK